jgi:hypothetical protein
MSGGDDWKPGELALCVREGVIWCGPLTAHTGEYAPQKGYCGEVVSTAPSMMFDGEPCPSGCMDLVFADGRAGLSQRFRRIPPLTDEERDEFLADLNVPVREVRHA